MSAEKQKRPDLSKKMSVQTNSGDNTRYLDHNMQVSDLANEPVDMTSPEEVQKRILAYFELCTKNDVKPNVAALALAFGVTRKCLWEWVNGITKSITPSVRSVLERAYQILNAQMEDYMQNGKIHPVAGIFLMKNNMGYEDKKEVSVVPATPFGDEIPAEELRQKYLKAAESNDTKLLAEIPQDISEEA